MFFTVRGTYKDGKVELAEAPAEVEHAQVLVTFLTPETVVQPPRRLMIYGQFTGRGMSTDEDFCIAEWRGEIEA